MKYSKTIIITTTILVIITKTPQYNRINSKDNKIIMIIIIKMQIYFKE